jgi:hypothetical protein
MVPSGRTSLAGVFPSVLWRGKTALPYTAPKPYYLSALFVSCLRLQARRSQIAVMAAVRALAQIVGGVPYLIHPQVLVCSCKANCRCVLA